MIASLYHSGSSSRVKPSLNSGMGISHKKAQRSRFCASLWLLLSQYMSWNLVRPQLNVISCALPGEFRATDQIHHSIRRPHVNSQILYRQFQKPRLRPHRIEIDDSHNEVALVGSPFAVTDKLVVIDGVELQIPIRLQRRIFLSNCIHTRDERPKTRGIVHITMFDLIFLRVQILLTSGLAWNVFAQFICRTVYPVIRAERSC